MFTHGSCTMTTDSLVIPEVWYTSLQACSIETEVFVLLISLHADDLNCGGVLLLAQLLLICMGCHSACWTAMMLLQQPVTASHGLECSNVAPHPKGLCIPIGCVAMQQCCSFGWCMQDIWRHCGDARCMLHAAG